MKRRKKEDDRTKVVGRGRSKSLCRILSIVTGASGLFSPRDNEQTLRSRSIVRPGLYNVNTMCEEWKEEQASEELQPPSQTENEYALTCESMDKRVRK